MSDARAAEQGRQPGGSQDLAEVMARIARGLRAQPPTVETTLEAITSAAVAAVPGAEDGGVSLVVGRSEFRARASTSDRPAAMDALEDRLGQGPCLDAIRHEPVVHIQDMSQEQRWPRFAAAASSLGVGSMLCFRLYVTDRDLGALNLFAGAPRSFTEESQVVGRIFSAHAAIALASAEREGNLERALRSRDLIGQAKGILMARYGLTADEAFAVLARTSATTNRRITELAEDITSTGDVPR